MKEYALYHGDEFIVLGTIKEIAKFQNVKEDTIKFYANPCSKKRNNKYILIKIEEGDE